MSLQTISSIITGVKMDIEQVKKQIAEFEAKLKPIYELTPKEQAAAKAKWEKGEADKAARKTKWPEIEKRKGEILLKGITVSPGLAIGKVRVIHIVTSNNRIESVNDHEVLSKTKKGEILVVENAKPEDYVYLKKAAAIVADSGGKTSNAAIYARMLDIPGVTGTVEGTSILQDGQKVIVDGTEGAVYACNE